MKTPSFLFLLTATLLAAEPVTPGALVADITAQHPELQFYREEVAAARAGVRVAGRRAAPEASIELGRKRVHDAAGLVAGEGTAWSVSLSQTFEWPGRLALRKAIANQDVALAELGLARFESALRARATSLAFGLSAAQIRADAAREVAARYAALKEVFLAREPGGLTPLLETRVIEAQEIALQRRATEARLALSSALTELNQLRGVAPDRPLAVAPAALKFNAPPATEALLAAARENHFEFRARRLEFEQQGLNVRLARHELRPAFTVSPFVSQENAGEKETVVGLGLSLPLGVGGSSRAGVDLASARLRQAEAAVRAAEREMEREVVNTAAAFVAHQEEAARWQPAAIAQFRDAAETADRHYRLGAVPLATYVELQGAYLDAVESLLATQQDALDAGLRLQLLTGLDFKAVEVSP
jgi:cobalt-zinc-cadmium efflux system outer membrane protein